ncbi:MAG TPA: class I SAM-dependent methyltransferase [Puia sp.]
MPVLSRLKQYLFPVRQPETPPAEAYDKWALNYDDQPDNLMLALDEEVCAGLLEQVDIRGKVVADIGCGTGRHWQKILERRPARLFGYDVSSGMLDILRQKYPDANTCLLESQRLKGLGDETCDLVLSTLTVAHIPNLETSLREWHRVLRPGGDILITDYHPRALARGGQRTFRDGAKTIAVRNYIHTLKKINNIARRLDLDVLSQTERKIDNGMRHYYEKQNAMDVFSKFYGVPIIYGIHLKKPDEDTFK